MNLPKYKSKFEVKCPLCFFIRKVSYKHQWSIDKGYTTKRCFSCSRRYGENNWKWIKDRSKLKKKELRNDSAYRAWRDDVWKRDNRKCRIADNSCNGRIEAHHILGWKDYPELRYQLNNGITLCHAHHPRKRSEEAKLSPYFQKLVAEKN